MEFNSGEMSSVYGGSTPGFAFDGDLTTMAHSDCNTGGGEIWMKLTLSNLAVVTKLTVWLSHLGYWTKWRFSGTKVYVRLEEGEERYCGNVTIPTESGQTSSDVICGHPIIGNEVVFRQQMEYGSAACIHVYEVEAYGFESMYAYCLISCN